MLICLFFFSQGSLYRPSGPRMSQEGSFLTEMKSFSALSFDIVLLYLFDIVLLFLESFGNYGFFLCNYNEHKDD